MSNYNSKAVFAKILAGVGIRPSVQRVAILEYVSLCECHPTAEEIYAFLLKDNPMLSRTTVFSNLRLLAEKSLINDIDILSDSTRYDKTTDPPHAHFMCRRCRRIFDVPIEMPMPLPPSEFQCDNVNVFFKGICQECVAKSDRKLR